MSNHPFRLGENYFIRTVTHHYTGRLVEVYPSEIVLEDAAWIADDGRFSDAIESGKFNDVEPYPDGVQVIISRGSIVDACIINFPLPRTRV